MLLFSALFALKFKSVQTYLARKLARHFSEELHTTIRIESLEVKLFSWVELKGLLVKDLQKDTLLYAPGASFKIRDFSYFGKRIGVEEARLEGGNLYLKKYRNGKTNLAFIIDYFKPGKTPTEPKTPGKPYALTIDKILLNNARLRYKDLASTKKAPADVINFGDLDLRNFNVSILGLDTREHIAKARLDRMTFREKSGFYLRELSALAVIDTGYMEFGRLTFQTENTRLTDYLRMDFSDYNDFSDFTTKVRIKSRLRNSVIDPRDLNYFVPGTRSVDLKLNVDGDISGYVGRIKARNFQVKAGQASYVKGNFDITGLPDIDQTLLDLEFERSFTNKKDAERILHAITGKEERLPDMIAKLGDIYFKGRFSGFPKDFIADGEFKTSLGRVVSDVNMKLGKVPVYTGRVRAFDFDIGNLLDNPTLSRTSFSVNIKGQSFDYGSLNEKLEGKVSYFDFKGYRYKNIVVGGAFNKKLFKGRVNVDDPNVKLDFDGGIDLNPTLPVFDFVATIRNANLHTLHLAKDTLQVDADFNANFAGSNLDNIQGNVFLNKIRLTNPANSIVVDSVSLAAQGTGTARSLSIKSDILDAEIKGEYDLATLPSYFIATAKQYIPSLSLSHKQPERQNFELSLKLKYFEPISLLVAPELKIPEGATLNGKFVSDQNLFTFSGGASKVEYKGIKITNVIIDESSMGKALSIVLTSDRINFSDSLYVKNVNIANILENDSLNLNIKLSDKNATNQLDLNGLVEFGKDTTATFSLLPSDVIINHENWKVQEKVRIGFDKGKTTVSGFQLSRDNQVLSLNGTISSDPNDQLVAEFNKFKLTTFNPLSAGAGVKFGGVLNGKATLVSLLKNPGVDANLKVDSLAMNNTAIGDMQFNAAFDNETKLVKTSILISKGTKETLRINGNYDARSETNSLDMDVLMDKSELIIFEPFVKGLVSHLRGTVSAGLKLSGTLAKPVINGDLSFNDASLTVDYLKTPYRINDKVTIRNSVIALDGLVLKDPRNSQAIARGKVDMTNPSDPYIDVVLNAQGTPFLALNTTSKDNPLYYGTAYGTGTFLFKGPVSNLYINIDAKTGPGTVFNIPLNAASTVTKNEFITFISKRDSGVVKPAKATKFNGLTMNFSLKVDDESEVNIFTDIGKLTGRGESDNLNLTISSAGDFIMTGTYEITSGRFVFSPRDYINKVFDITTGGTIKWAGDPRQAMINLQAAYRARADVTKLYEAAGSSAPVSGSVLVEAVINLSGNLMKPNIVFDLNFPSNSEIKDNLSIYLNDANNVYLQAISFVATRSFTSSGADLTSTSSLTTTGANAATELLFNQLTSALGNLGAGRIDLNIRSLNEASATIRLFNQRLILTGGVNSRRQLRSDIAFISDLNQIDRDVEIQYLIKADGSLALRGSNRPNSKNVLNLATNDYVSAFGLVYRQDFDSFGELLKIISGEKKREEKKKRAAKPDQPADKPDEKKKVPASQIPEDDPR